ncbi:MAG: hypothetical protein AVDCRST_MAG50-1183 [uncultured Acidimicrobiales bacterium]|uniref:Uncharacterized protein n=1 Tax=uncultured Acidimicrobiales bacterium TaxID=310071 RepID=A0A6J4HQP7_9ACTN|nr:MAG: hypothetical protein AVDCRST_MAG50-1183 [uncultured Acidimicrobiales bacterium]
MGVLAWLGLGSPAAMAQEKETFPVFECAAPNSDGTFTGFFGYQSGEAASVVMPVGAQNQFTTPAHDRGQPTTIAPGRHVAVFSVRFAAGDQVMWHLKTANAVADATKLCSAPAELAEVGTWLALPAASAASLAGWVLVQRRRNNQRVAPTPAG